MSGDAAAEAGGGICSLLCFSALSPWCDTKAFGSGGGNGVAGCCGSCCNKSFNEDSTDRWANAEEKAKVEAQPAPTEPMKVVPSTPAPEAATTEAGSPPATGTS